MRNKHREAPKPRDPSWRARRVLGHRVVRDRKREQARRACRGKAAE